MLGIYSEYETSILNMSTWFRKSLWAFLLGLGLLLCVYSFSDWHSIRALRSSTQEAVSLEEASQSTDTQSDTVNTVAPTSPAEPSKYGHLSYTEVDRNNLVVVSSFGLEENQRFERLHQDAAYAFMRMANTARDEGVWLVLLSAFREIDKQSELFEYQIQSKGSPEAAAKYSAPPGYSEHHTGYAMDVGDGHVPSSDINLGFADTQAFLWMTQNAGEFGFELSFPPNNSQGVSYEPWHWRFTGSPESQIVFAQANT